MTFKIPDNPVPKYKEGDRVHVVKTPIITDNFNCPPIIKGKIIEVMIVPFWSSYINYRVEFDSPLTFKRNCREKPYYVFEEWEIYPLETRGKLT